MYNDKTLFKFFLLFMKLIVAIGLLLIIYPLVVTASDNYALMSSGNLLAKSSIVIAFLTALLNIFQIVCLFVNLGAKMRVVYIVSVFVSSILLIFVSAVWLSIYSFMFLGLSLGILGLILISLQARK
ncbi:MULTISPECIES: hypothetical protein [Oenococcus]|uniref:Uncharacterized protein n=1 Tax=Oenococcus kitaharae DSM 17330 TaxID=1045004 RepID=G9WIC7_9LACO|nr:hypothetical protein [Oenococcus kitaharae]EHN58939.1 hypothetical protein OKIT_0830 [Oenococcus kitaharae DSM 17330]OEY81746.1 hypothetical protein NT96_08210 [Oenococcus kitaharae]OEY83977.1 hypothetical protein NT95_02270 [Oenococcus kitaharae]OEY85667.1 hypothetical protein NV75_04165 [Oenococcus kitaharae]